MTSRIDIVNKLFAPKTQGTFVGLKLTPESILKLEEILENSDLDRFITPHDYHLTLFYSTDKPITFYQPKVGFKYQASVNSIDFLGKGLVLKLSVGDDLMDRHNEIADSYGVEHSFDKLLPHVTVKYYEDKNSVVPSDLEILKRIIPDDLILEFDTEYSEPVDDTK
ncbi:structural protein [Yersinia phage vB_Yru_GN1]|uniref:Anti-CBASS protein Acb1 n=1 Tax=Yersinia phage vB_Yru_GN1 TaxID=3074381 RepID=A0AA86JCV0_9CAUD|nr:structural protein [Yersinia phage vB_Yru_GN1]